MGLEELIIDKLDKKIAEEIKGNQPEDPKIINNDEIEKASYSEHSYKEVKKLREKGKYHHVDVPYLQYPVQKQEKPRPILVVFAILTLLLTIAVIALGVMVFISIVLPLITSALGLGDMYTLQQWDIFGLVFAFTSLVPIFLWGIIIVTTIAIVLISVGMISLTKDMFKSTRISMQELAVGYKVQNLLATLGVVIAIVVAVGILLLVNYPNMTLIGKILIISIMLGVALILGTLFGLLLAQRIKAKKEFKQLPQEQQNDFIRHNRELERVKRRTKKSSQKSIIGSSVDF